MINNYAMEKLMGLLWITMNNEMEIILKLNNS